jgi:hypothetical protein
VLQMMRNEKNLNLLYYSMYYELDFYLQSDWSLIVQYIRK